MGRTIYSEQLVNNQGGIVQPTEVPTMPATTAEQYGQVGQPAAVAMINGEQVTMGELVRDPATGLAEPVYSDMPSTPTASDVAAGAPPISDPVKLAQWHGQQELSALSQFDQQLAAIQAPVQSALDTSYQQYRIDVEAIRNSGVPQEQQAQRINQLNANYQKKWTGLKGKTRLEEQAIQQQRQQAAFQLQLQQTLRMQQIQQYAQMAQDGYIDGPTALRLQYKTMGYEVPATFGKPSKSQDPIEQIKELRVVIDNANTVLNQYQYNDRTNKMLVVKPQDMWAGDKFNPKKDTRPATPAERQLYIQTRQEKRQAQAMQGQLRRQRLGIAVPDITSGTDPLSRSVKAMKSQRPAPSRPTGQIVERGGRRWLVVGYDAAGEALVERAQ